MKTPLPSPLKGRSPNPHQPNHNLEIQLAHQSRKEIVSIPSPLGEGQSDMPINHHNQGEVPHHLSTPFLTRRNPSHMLRLKFTNYYTRQ